MAGERSRRTSHPKFHTWVTVEEDWEMQLKASVKASKWTLSLPNIDKLVKMMMFSYSWLNVRAH